MKVYSFVKKIYNTISEEAKDSGRQMITFGIFGAIAYPLFGFLNLNVLQPKVYENIFLRLIIGVLCLGLALKNYWPQKLRQFLPLYWYFTLLLGLPFFFTFMMLKNQASNAWLLNLLTILFFVILVIDWLSAIFLFIIGEFIGWITYYLSTDHGFFYQLEPISYKDFIGAYIVTIILGILFSRNKKLSEKEKLKILSVSGSIAHELRTPLITIQLGIKNAKEYYPVLVEGYMQARNHKLEIKNIPTQQLKLISELFDDIGFETENANTFVDMMLMNLKQVDALRTNFQIYSMHECIQEAIQRYPFREGESGLISWENSDDFLFKGDRILFVHILFNLFKNSLFFIEAERKGTIHIWCRKDRKCNVLYFKDTARGITPKELSKLFEKFHSTTRHGTGLGLAYCKMVMTSFGGDIRCTSEHGKFIQFELNFPYIEPKKN